MFATYIISSLLTCFFLKPKFAGHRSRGFGRAEALLTHNQKSCWLAPKNCALGSQTGKGHNFHQNSHFRGPQAKKIIIFSYQCLQCFLAVQISPCLQKKSLDYEILRADPSFSTFSSSFLLQNRRTNEKEPDTENPEVERSRFR